MTFSYCLYHKVNLIDTPLEDIGLTYPKASYIIDFM